MHKKTLALAIGAIFSSHAAFLQAAPGEGRVVAGEAAIHQQGGNTRIEQGSQRAIINWKSFDIGKTEKVEHAMPSAASLGLHRVVGGGGASQIYGTLSSNGNLWLVNPAGMVFHNGAKVDVGGFVASAWDIGNDSFMLGAPAFIREGDPDLYTFPAPGAAIVNAGEIRADDAITLSAAVNVLLEDSGSIEGTNLSIDALSIDLQGAVKADGNLALTAGREISLGGGASDKEVIQGGGLSVSFGEKLLVQSNTHITMDGAIDFLGTGGAFQELIAVGAGAELRASSINMEAANIEIYPNAWLFAPAGLRFDNGHDYEYEHAASERIDIGEGASLHTGGDLYLTGKEITIGKEASLWGDALFLTGSRDSGGDGQPADYVDAQHVAIDYTADVKGFSKTVAHAENHLTAQFLYANSPLMAIGYDENVIIAGEHHSPANLTVYFWQSINQPSRRSTAKPTTLRSRLLNSTPIKWMG